MSSIGGRLLEERERLGLSQPRLAELCGVTMRSQRNYEKGERQPDALYLAALGAAGVDVLYVLTGARGGVVLTPDERELLALYRASSLTGKAAAVGALQGVIGQSAEKRGGFNMSFHAGVGQQTNVDGDATVNVGTRKRNK